MAVMLRDAKVAAIVPTVEVVPVEMQPQNEAYLDVWLDDGTHLQAQTDFVIGHPKNPMSWDDMHTKYTALVTPVMGGDKGEALYRALRSFDAPGALQQVYALLAGKPLAQQG